MAKIFLGFPTYDKKVDVEIMLAVARLPSEYPQHDFAIDFVSSSIITSARNYLVRRFLESECDWLYFWDSDVVIRDLTFIGKLLETAEKLDADIVGGIYRLKNDRKNYASGVRNGNNIVNLEVGQVPEPRLIDGLTTGAMMISRKVLETISDPWFSFIDIPGSTIPEDFNFCSIAQKAGFKVAVDPRFGTFHYGTAFWEHKP